MCLYIVHDKVVYYFNSTNCMRKAFISKRFLPMFSGVSQVQLRHLQGGMALDLFYIVSFLGISLQMMCHLPKTWLVSVIIVFSLWIGYRQTSTWDCLYLIFLSCNTYPLQQANSERPRSSSRNGSSSKKPVLSSSRPSSSGEPSESRTSRLVLSSGRLSTTQRLQPGFESKTSLSRASATRGGRDDTLRSFELLSLGSGKRKWRTVWSADFLCQGS